MRRHFIIYIASLAVLALASQAAAQETKLKWFGHAAFSITTPNGKVLLIDPWLRNPSNPEGKDNKDALAAVSKVDYILLTHGHRDHVGEAVEIAKKTGALLIANPELAGNLDEFAANLKQLKIPFYEMNPGDTVTFRGRQLVRSR